MEMGRDWFFVFRSLLFLSILEAGNLGEFIGVDF
jgi:hypothetical protein